MSGVASPRAMSDNPPASPFAADAAADAAALLAVDPPLAPSLSWWHAVPSVVTGVSLCPDSDLLATTLRNPPPCADPDAEALVVRSLNGRTLCALPVEPVCGRDALRAPDEAGDAGVPPLAVAFRALVPGVDPELAPADSNGDGEAACDDVDMYDAVTTTSYAPSSNATSHTNNNNDDDDCDSDNDDDDGHDGDAARAGATAAAAAEDEEDEAEPCSVATAQAWCPRRRVLALGLSTGAVALYAVDQGRRVAWMQAHAAGAAVVAMHWALLPADANAAASCGGDVATAATAAASAAAGSCAEMSTAAFTAAATAAVAHALSGAAPAPAAVRGAAGGAGASLGASLGGLLPAWLEPPSSGGAAGGPPVAPVPALPVHSKDALGYERDRKLVAAKPAYGREVAPAQRTALAVTAGSPFAAVPALGTPLGGAHHGPSAAHGHSAAHGPQSALLAAAMTGPRGAACDARGALAAYVSAPIAEEKETDQPPRLDFRGAGMGQLDMLAYPFNPTLQKQQQQQQLQQQLQQQQDDNSSSSSSSASAGAATASAVSVLVTADARGRIKVWGYGWYLLASFRLPRGVLAGRWGVRHSANSKSTCADTSRKSKFEETACTLFHNFLY